MTAYLTSSTPQNAPAKPFGRVQPRRRKADAPSAVPSAEPLNRPLVHLPSVDPKANPKPDLASAHYSDIRTRHSDLSSVNPSTLTLPPNPADSATPKSPYSAILYEF
ncbi:hypothetical protein N7490_002433 [Penicillium lividum]|nr:hypothetical protein N7490_002433 [Penicillium lividum]